MKKNPDAIQLTTLEIEAIRLWLEEVFFAEPEKSLYDADWSDDEVSDTIAAICKKFQIER